MVCTLKKENLNKFAEELSYLSWATLLEIADDSSLAYDKYMSILQPIFAKACPLRAVKHKKDKPRKPWITEQIISERNKKKSAIRISSKYSGSD
jgi:hypothetical protein